MRSFWNVIVRRTTSSYNKEDIFSAGEGTVESQMLAIDWLNVNYVCFMFFYELWDRFNLRITSCYECFLDYFCETSAVYLSNECFNWQWAISLFIFLLIFMYSEIWTAICNILNACFTVHYSSLITILLPRDRLDRIS